MTTYCDNKKDWAGKSEAKKLEVVKKLVEESLGDEGAAPVKFKVVKDLKHENGLRKNGLYKNGVVLIDKDHLNNGDYDDVVDTAFHEAEHGLNDQKGWPTAADLASQDDPVGPEATTSESGIYISQKGTRKVFRDKSSTTTAEEDKELDTLEETDARDYAASRLKQEKKKCKKTKGTESSSKKTLPKKAGWKSPATEASHA